MVSVSNFSEHWIKEIQIRWLGDDLQTILSLLIGIYRYYDNMLKHMPKDALKIFKEALKEEFVTSSSSNRR